VPGTVIGRDYLGSRPRGGGSLHPATTHYNGTMCTGYNGCVGRDAICYVLAILAISWLSRYHAPRAPPRRLIKAPGVGITVVPGRIQYGVLD
jgi:hypothetical protein